jgi:hypothetical protein
VDCREAHSRQMKDPHTGETCRHLSALMLECLHGCYTSDPKPYNIRTIPTAKALMLMGMIERVSLSVPISVNSGYVITERGRTAYRITKRLSGVS